ncbi:peptide ABC transporter substrate-binding protein [Clostridium estertheticum]|uniref:peptide ABC transporter substrate-binding protein n=1 Tax=Clostridium estertheticum TaxID=238834 RepID=UPI001C0AF8E2|nr:peptide ABC transporter substrate-binding protein [Clostridium estertheticum]MBU3184058.1 peptide ABC transporter substrate-binding protein [Clostridium estertheticum]
MKKILCVILIFMIMFTSGCVQKKVTTSISRKYIVYNLGELPSDLLMVDNDNIREKDLLLVLFEGLVREDKDGKIVPGMAEKYDISKDKIGYTFKLRKDLHYSDGTDIKATDFVRFFHDILLEKGNNFSEQLYCIFGAKDFSMGKVAFDRVGIVASKDNLSLEIRLNSPKDNFINILSNPIFTLRDDSTNMKNWKDNYKQIEYSGPFIIKNINKDGEITLLKNQKYWRANEIVSSEMLFTSVIGDEKALADFETNGDSANSKIDVFVSPPISEISTLSDEKKTEVKPTQSRYYLNFNLKDKGLVDQNFRNAINEIINRKLIIETLSEDLAVPTMNYTTYTSINDNSDKLIFDESRNKSKGQEFLKNSTYDKEQKLVMVYENKNFDTKISGEIAKSIKKYLNIDVVCTGYKKDDLKKVINSGNYNIVFTGNDEEYGDSYKFFSKWIANSKDNIYGYKNANYDKIIDKALMENNNNKKITIYNQAQKILAKDLPCIPIYIANTVICKKANIKDIYTTKGGNLKFDYAYKDNVVTK